VIGSESLMRAEEDWLGDYFLGNNRKVGAKAATNKKFSQ